MIKKDERRLKVGVLGAGPIAQFAHLESCVKARNADLYAICDVAPDLLERMAWTYKPERSFASYAEMLADFFQGVFALGANTSGGQNTAFGDTALNFNTTGSFNTAVGFDALKDQVDKQRAG